MISQFKIRFSIVLWLRLGIGLGLELELRIGLVSFSQLSSGYHTGVLRQAAGCTHRCCFIFFQIWVTKGVCEKMHE